MRPEEEWSEWEATVGKHADEHGCGCPRGPHCLDPEGHVDGHRYPGTAYCPVAVELVGRLRPDQIPPVS